MDRVIEQSQCPGRYDGPWRVPSRLRGCSADAEKTTGRALAGATVFGITQAAGDAQNSGIPALA